MRAGLFEALGVLGAVDGADAARASEASALLSRTLDLVEARAALEEAIVHRTLEELDPGSSAAAAAAHARHRETIAPLRDTCALLARVPEASRPLVVRRLYASFALLVAAQLEHMHSVETTLASVLFAHLGDAALEDLAVRLARGLTPDHASTLLTWTARAATPLELELARRRHAAT